ncbi:hypothetical protein [Kribbella jiaozuonensis]|uniref:Uncharacterized protein n=1 Tax=Kribbella jiaozuonensis TaxID=2575441 RepID=A0A4U3LFK5_9ACTN|nr:hypothetical protein [Kribbella jiaozuonensis]TKK74308.1 hypothetical protein FDA38_36580 [Kribbella jiaozuonensis]
MGVGLALRGSDDPERVNEGDAFGKADGSYEIGIHTARINDDVWYFAPAITNQSSEKLMLEDVEPGTLPDGLSFVGARLFDKEAFIAGIPMSWDSSGGSANDDPSTKPSTAVEGFTLLPGQTLPDDKIVYLHLRVTTSRRPLKSDGVRFIYEQRGKRYAQTLSANLTIAPSTPQR